jgi:hypothetical protein
MCQRQRPRRATGCPDRLITNPAKDRTDQVSHRNLPLAEQHRTVISTIRDLWYDLPDVPITA